MIEDGIVVPPRVSTTERASWVCSSLVFLVAVDLVLVFLHLVLVPLSDEIAPLLDLDGEATVPAWYSSVKLLVVGGLIAFLAYRSFGEGWPSIALAAIAIAFVGMSLDETVGIHERVGFVVDLLVVNRADTALHATGAWFVVVGLPVALAVGWLFYRSATILDAVGGTSTRLLLGLAVFFSGALIVEGLTNLAVDPQSHHRLVALEEGLELTGITVILSGMIVCVRRHPLTAPILTLAGQPRSSSDAARRGTLDLE